MANHDLINSFTADQLKFFPNRTPTDEQKRKFHGIRSTAHARYRAKNRYDVAILSLRDDGELTAPLEKNKLYFEIHEGNLKYRFITSSGDTKRYLVDRSVFGEAELIQPLTLEMLQPHLPEILKLASKRGHNGFHFVAEHLPLLEQQFADLYASLPKEGNERNEFWLYCYFCCVTLENYYLDDAYPNPSKAKKYRDLAKKIEHKCETGAFHPGIDEAVLAADVGKAFKDGLNYIADTVQHTTAIRAWLGFINLYRILFVFGRLSVKQGLILLNQHKWLDSLGKLLNRNLDVDAWISMINAPTGIFNALSVGIFEVRLFITLCETFKHVFLVDTEKEASRTKSERLYHELFVRILDIYNDLAWSTVNTLCNYGYLAGPLANWLTAGFLVLDAVALFARLGFAYDDYTFKTAQYNHERANILMIYDVALRNKYLEVLVGKEGQLNIDWQAQKAELLFAAAGALLLASGFSTTLLLTGPAAAIVGFVSCTVAVAMYISSGKYGDYTRASLAHKNQDLPETLAAANDAYSAFAWSMAKNSVMPFVMVTAFAVYWPAALVLAASYIAYESSGGTSTKKLIPEYRPAEGAKTEDQERDDDIQFMKALG